MAERTYLNNDHSSLPSALIRKRFDLDHIPDINNPELINILLHRRVDDTLCTQPTNTVAYG